ncbi:putative ATP-dependent carboligase, ATP-grasp superfamily [Prauserella flava]|nr:putative ATP-dependent carboligase, ATP-grasp superfamily [Prauserella flava]MCR3732801.1 putative ATP-dependent carboligase, ATP-grasp superfamily [Prauserella salsuginis]
MAGHSDDGTYAGRVSTPFNDFTDGDTGGDETRQRRGPVMIACFDGWNDAGDAASTAIEHLALNWDATPLAELEPDDYYDFQVARPTVRMVDGVTRRVEWPTTRLSVCRPAGADQDVVLVQGPEPSMRWRAFCAELLEHVEQLGVQTVITIGALVGDTAHTRPIPVTGTAYDAEAAKRFGLERERYQGPTGIVGVFQDLCVKEGVPAVSLWAVVPHYVSHPPSPKATIALLNKLEDILDVGIPLGALPEQAEDWQKTVSEMADEDEEISEYVRSLEERGDAEIDLEGASGDMIAAEFERYLRRRRNDGPGPAGR